MWNIKKTAEQATNWSRKHFYANKMTAVILFLLDSFQNVFFSFAFFYFSSMWICLSNKNIQTWSYEWKRAKSRRRNLRVDLHCRGSENVMFTFILLFMQMFFFVVCLPFNLVYDFSFLWLLIPLSNYKSKMQHKSITKERREIFTCIYASLRKIFSTWLCK